MFEKMSPAPPDAILGLTEEFKADHNPDKVNLGVGVYKDESGKTPVLECVKTAERILLDEDQSKTYLPIPGSPEYGAIVQSLLVGGEHPIVTGKRARTAHTPGGTGAIRVGGDFIAEQFPGATIWVSNPTWANHKGVFAAAGLSVKVYSYYDAETRGLDFAAMQRDLQAVPAGDIVLLHLCCHNPTGVDPSPEEWKSIARIAAEKGWIPFVDFAYQGFGSGLETDAEPLRILLEEVEEMFVASSFSKNFGLYKERVGAFTLVASTSAAADAAFSHVKKTIRVLYSNPPAHGGMIVSTVLSSDHLTAIWHKELDDMRDRINGVRRSLVDALRNRGADFDFSFIARQKGMFSFSGLNNSHVDFLRDTKSIYIVKGGRINVAGITPTNIDYVCDAIAEALKKYPM
ncbi:MAG: aspartate/tyrosine/aromatic aminotransferase [Verrucomicrobia bacterium]|nr:aspartate/tyrosine/aromatic aminotransferase [Verrucomicrobiota bacterium]